MWVRFPSINVGDEITLIMHEDAQLSILDGGSIRLLTGNGSIQWI